MSLKKLFKPTKSLKLKLALLYSCLLVLSSLVLFLSVYAYFASAFTQHDRALIQTELREMADEYNNNDIKSVESLLEKKRKFHRQHSFLVRLADAKNRTLGTYIPLPWTEFNINDLEKVESLFQTKWLRLQAFGGNHYLEVGSMLLQNGNWMQVGMSSEEREKILLRFRTTFLPVIGPMVVLAFISGWVIASYVLRPVKNLITAVKSVGSGEIDTRVSVRGTGDELDELAIHFNEMLRKIETLLKAMKDCLDNVAHDLRTPVTRLRNLAEEALQAPRNLSDQHVALASCAEEAERINTMLNILLNISEAESGIMRIDYEDTDILSLVENIVDAYRLIADDKLIKIVIDGDNTLTGMIDPNRMSQALANLMDNAVKYTFEGGEVRISFYREEDHIIICVQDNGTGIPPEEVSWIWDRLYRGKQKRYQNGLGLGLSQAKAIIDAHNGNIQVSSEPDKGSSFTIRLPVSIRNSPHRV